MQFGVLPIQVHRHVGAHTIYDRKFYAMLYGISPGDSPCCFIFLSSVVLFGTYIRTRVFSHLLVRTRTVILSFRHVFSAYATSMTSVRPSVRL